MTAIDRNTIGCRLMSSASDSICSRPMYANTPCFWSAEMGRCGAGTPERNGSLAIRRRKSSDSISPACSRRKTFAAASPSTNSRRRWITGHAASIRWQIRKDGTRFWCQATTTPLFDENKQVRSFARVMHDLTEGQAQEAQKKRADDLAEANRSKEEFMALLSHELRNPLSPILNALNVQRQVKTDDPILQQAGDIIERQVGHMVRMVDDLLDISRITKGKLRLNKERVELRVIVNRAAESARPFSTARKHEFSMSLPTEPIWVEADATRLEQIVVNLLNNAAKYTDPGGLIRLSVSSAGGEAILKVWDNGLGMPPEMLPRIFDLFTQVDAHAQPVSRRARRRPGISPHAGRDARWTGAGLQRRFE